MLFLFICSNAFSLHIAGGDMEIRHVTGYQYRLYLNLFFDEINARPEYRDDVVEVTVFEKGTNRLMMTVTMPLREQKLLEYAIVDCQSEELKISKILYYQDLQLDPATFNHPQGYYAVWERCCRSKNISNIALPEEAGQAFYLEFPAVVKAGGFFSNSSPLLPPPFSDYACLNEPFTYTFNATDADGDQLVYDLVTPLNGHATYNNTTPKNSPEPYPEISWLAGYSKDTAVPGAPPLSIDRRSGKLTVTPNQKGLFIFGVRCQEFRNGVKIGEVRRDMQLMVKECTLNRPPVVTAKAIGSAKAYDPSQVLRIRQRDSRCVDIYFTDPDKNESLTLKAQPVNFSGSYFYFTGQTSGSINKGSSKDTLQATLCFEDCMNSSGQAYLLDLIVSDYGDKGCGQPKQDTLRLSFIIEGIPDKPPTLSISPLPKVLEVYEGETLRLDVVGTDPDKDSLSVTARGVGFDLASQNISFKAVSGQGKVNSSFSWQIDCKALEQTAYQVEFQVTSTRCGTKYSHTELVEIIPKHHEIQNNTVAAEQNICFGTVPATLTGSEPTGGSGPYTYTWEMSTISASDDFSPAPGENNKQHYVPGTLKQTTWFRRRVTSGPCTYHLSEAVAVVVNPQPILRQAPSIDVCPGAKATLTAESFTSDTVLEWYSQPTGGDMLYRGDSFVTPSLGVDTDYYVQAVSSQGCVSEAREKVTVRVHYPKGDAGLNVSIIAGGSAGLRAQGGVSYEWSPAETLSDPTIGTPVATPLETTTYTVIITTPYGCTFVDQVTVEVIPRIKPANAITLNGDGLNETWYIENIEYYPNCHIQIFTRWGAKVFESTGYSIPWDGTHQGQQLPMAAYYYIIQLDDKEKPISGSITLIK